MMRRLTDRLRRDRRGARSPVVLPVPPDAHDTAEGFYGGVLGMSRVTPEQLAASDVVRYEAGQVVIDLRIDPAADAPTRPARPTRGPKASFVVGDLDAMAERLRQAGAPWFDGVPTDGVRRARTADPFGNPIELVALDRSDPPRR